MAVDTVQALQLAKTRLNRLASDTSLDDYLAARISAALGELNAMLPRDLDDSTEDLLLLVDYAVWSYQNRDKAEREPAWLRYRIRCRFLRQREQEVPE